MSDFHKHSSWGRTRRLKNIAGTDGTALVDQPLCPTNETTGNDVVRTISAATKSGDVVTLTISADTNIVAGDVIHITGNGSLNNRTFQVLSKPANTTITIRLPQDMKNITPQAGGSLRRRTKIGYATENQRFLHLITAQGVGNDIDAIWAYSYATGIWAELKQTVREVKTQDDAGADDLDTTLEVSVVVGHSSHRVVEISGIDRVAFNLDGTVYAAMSTF